MLLEKYSVDDVARALYANPDWQAYPPACDRDAWEGLLGHPVNRQRRDYLALELVKMLRNPWPQLPATLLMEFVRNGDRQRFEKEYFARRARLGCLVMMECMDYRGQHIDAIIDAMWSICEEATWALSAHMEREEEDPLPRHDCHTVALFSAETGYLMALCLHLLGDELTMVSGQFCKRVNRHLMKRLVEPVENEAIEYWWYDGHNNWTPWCCSNLLGLATIVIDDNARLAPFIYRLMGFVDAFINRSSNDGGCDEGPNYWSVAAGRMLAFLELLYERTGGTITIYDEEKIERMGRFVFDTHLAGPWYVNFADASARAYPSCSLLTRFAARYNSQDIANFAIAFSNDPAMNSNAGRPWNLQRTGAILDSMLTDLHYFTPDTLHEPVCHRRTEWYPDVQVMVSREREDPDYGLQLAIKGGHNGENHNHNDVGQFIVMCEGHPIIVDTGTMVYTRKTFSSERYEIWNIRSSAHNVPMIDGVEQCAGESFCARQVRLNQGEEADQLKMEISAAYPEEAGLRSAHRTSELDRQSGCIRLRDQLIGKAGAIVIVPLYSLYESREHDGDVLIQAPIPVLMRCPELGIRIETVELDDASMRATWGDRLFRVELSYELDEIGEGEMNLSFERAGG